jgi:hypothetical protein
VKVLRLGSSIDMEGDTPLDQRGAAVAERMLAEACGEPVETVTRAAWPTAKFPDMVERWVREVEPDIVSFGISSFWCEAEMVSLKMNDRLGRPGKRVAHFVRRIARDSEVMERWAAQASRKLALSTIGGRPPFSPEQVAERVEASLHRILRRESVAVSVTGSPYSPAMEGGPAARFRARRRRADQNARIRLICDRLHVDCDLPEHAPDAFSRDPRTRDAMHFGPEAHRVVGEIQGRGMVRAWQQSRGDAPGAAGRTASAQASRSP